MGPFTSVLTSLVVAICGAGVQWAINHGIVPSGDKSVLVQDLVAVVSFCGMAAFTYLKAKWQTQKAMIEHINHTDNGVKVVASTVVAPTEEAPLK